MVGGIIMRLFGLGSFEWLIILLIAVILFGVGRITKVGKNLEQSLRSFRHDSHEEEITGEFRVIDDETERN
jgi:TatA/E family protein of Tat protein translocase